MHHYKPLSNTIEVPYVPENFVSILAEIAEDGYLFPERAPLRAEVERQRPNYLRIRIPDRSDVLVLRFDTLEVRRENDHTVRYRVSYLGSLHAVSRGLTFLSAARQVLIFLLILSAGRIHKSPAFSNFTRFTNEPMGGENGTGARPLLRPIGKRPKEIASVLPS